MKRALALARRGAGFVSPNPQVGALLTDISGRVVAEGWHHAVGQDHAEIDVLRKVGFKARGLELFVNLEPCNHHGRTPPCTDAILESGLRRVVVAMVDPNPLVAGRGIDTLRRHGVTVEVGLCENEARRLNEAFVTFITRGRPFVVAKAAVTLDGQLATRRGDSGQDGERLSSVPALAYAHRLRRELDAILVGAGTVVADDPQLTCRLAGRVRQPLRVVLDGLGRSNPAARVFDVKAALSLLLTTSASKAGWRRTLEARGVEVWTFEGRRGHIDIDELLTRLASRGVTSLLVEGGGQTLAAFLEAGAIDRLDLVYTPRLIGAPGVPLFNGRGVDCLTDAPRLRLDSVRRLGPDLFVQVRFTGTKEGGACLPA